MTTPPNHNTADQSGADERAKFEAWSRSMDLILDGNYYNSYVGAHYVYSDFTTDTAFRAFRAALQSNQAPQPFPAPAVQSGELPELPHLIPTDDLGIRQAMLEYARQAIAQTAPAVAGETITDEQIDEVWLNTKWDDLQPLRQGFNEALRHRFARDLLKFTAPSQGAKQ